MADAANFDRQMAPDPVTGRPLCWYSLPQSPVEISGLGFPDSARPWHRLPTEAETVLGPEYPELLELSSHTAGVTLRFATDSPEVWVRACLTAPPYMAHMTPAAQCGFDAYIRSPREDSWHFRGLSKFPIGDDRLQCCLAANLEGLTEVCIHLPLYIGITSLSLGLCPGAGLQPCRPFRRPGAIAVYGTSIDQGGCASRPGMAYPAILSRDLEMPVYNMGFSGNGLGQLPMADVLCTLPDLKLLVVDIQANAGPQGLLRRNLPAFLDRVRSLQPELPILVLSASPQADEANYLQSAGTSFREDEAFQLEQVQQRNRTGDRAIRYTSSRALLGDLAEEATVDGVHLTDLGFYALAKGLEPEIREML